VQYTVLCAVHISHTQVPATVYVKKTALGHQAIDISGIEAPQDMSSVKIGAVKVTTNGNSTQYSQEHQLAINTGSNLGQANEDQRSLALQQVDGSDIYQLPANVVQHIKTESSRQTVSSLYISQPDTVVGSNTSDSTVLGQ